jgi:hypothetical protein
MGEAQLELPPTTNFPPSTPSGLTPNSRSEAEAALRRNSLVQTDSAAPLLPFPGAGDGSHGSAPVDEAQRAYRGKLPRQSSTNYEKALNAWKHQASASSNFSNTSFEEGDNNADNSILTDRTVASPSGMLPFPKPGEGVVPLHNGVASGQAEAVKKARPHGLSLGSLGRQQSWSEQDMKHVLSAHLMGRREDGGYDSGADAKPMQG